MYEQNLAAGSEWAPTTDTLATPDNLVLTTRP